VHIEGPIVTASAPIWLKKLDRALGLLIAIPTALLVLLEIFVLLGGVIARYAFHSPIIWSDELASTLFLWLAMLGSAIALHRAEHMRMTAFVGMLSPPKRLALDVVATAAALTFLLLILPSAYEFAMDEIAVTTPAM
jgi:TRAP-type C4-dicarboxylate transport system permease small subunit